MQRPVVGIEEVGDDHDARPHPDCAADPPQGGGEGRGLGRRARSAARCRAPTRQRRHERRLALASRPVHQRLARRTPRGRPGCRRRGARSPKAAAAASTTSRFSEPIVPKSRLAERSTTIHVSIERSSSVRRTKVSPARAVRFQSMSRASSPARRRGRRLARCPARGRSWRGRRSARPSSRRVTARLEPPQHVGARGHLGRGEAGAHADGASSGGPHHERCRQRCPAGSARRRAVPLTRLSISRSTSSVRTPSASAS